jgi:hypothetical protein
MAAVGVLAGILFLPSVVQAAPTVTFTLSLNDDGFGDVMPGSFAIYATDSLGDNYGIAGLDAEITGLSPADFFEDDLPYGIFPAGKLNSAKDATVVAGFNTEGPPSFPIGGVQDLAGVGMPQGVVLIYAVGQTSENLVDIVEAATGVHPIMPDVIYQGDPDILGVPLLVADGTFSPGENLAFTADNQSALVFTENGQNNFIPGGTNTVEANIETVVQDISVPEPASLAFFAVAATGLMTLRKQR